MSDRSFARIIIPTRFLTRPVRAKVLKALSEELTKLEFNELLGEKPTEKEMYMWEEGLYHVVYEETPCLVWTNSESAGGGYEECEALEASQVPFFAYHEAGVEYGAGSTVFVPGEPSAYVLRTDGQVVAVIDMNSLTPSIEQWSLTQLTRYRDIYTRLFPNGTL